MINQQFVSGSMITSGKKPLKLSSKIFSILIIFIQIGIILRMGYLYTKGDYGDPWYGLFQYSIPLLVFSIVGLFVSVGYLKNRSKSYISIILLISSIISFPYIAERTSLYIIPQTSLFGKSASDIYKESPEYKNIRSGIDEQKGYTKIITTEFKNPQKVLFVDDKLLVLILDNGYVVQLSNNPINMSDVNQAVFIKWAKDNLVGKEVNFQVPNLKADDDFISGSVTPCGSDVPDYATSKVIEVRRKYGIQEDKGGFCGIIPVDINYEGKSLFNQFCGNWTVDTGCPVKPK